MKHAHRITLGLVLFALVSFIACRGMSRAGGAAVGGVLGSTVGPMGTAAGAAAGALAGDPLADALGADQEYTAKEYRKLLEDAHKTIAELQARKPIEVPVEVPRPFIPPWVWWSVGGFLAFRFRHGLAALFASLTTGGVKAALLTLAGIVWGGPVADKAKEAVTEHEQNTPRALALRRLRRVPPPPAAPPTSQTSKETLPHDA